MAIDWTEKDKRSAAKVDEMVRNRDRLPEWAAEDETWKKYV